MDVQQIAIDAQHMVFQEELRQIYTKELQISRRNQVDWIDPKRWIVTDPPFGDFGDDTVLYMIGTLF